VVAKRLEVIAGEALRWFAAAAGAGAAPVALALLLLPGAGPASAQQRMGEGTTSAYSFGVFPFLPAARLETVFAPVAGELGRALGREIRYRSAASYEKFAARLARQEFDIAHVQPFDYVRIAVSSGYLPVAARNAELTAVAVVPEESAVRELRDLAGSVVALPPEGAATAILGALALARSGLDPRRDVTVRHLLDQDSCIHLVVTGGAAACFTGSQAARLYQVRTGRRLRVIGRSPPIPHTLFVVHSRVPRADREIIRRTLLGLTLQGLAPELRDFLAGDGSRPFVPVQDADYDIVREYARTVERGR